MAASCTADLAQGAARREPPGERVISQKTSEQMRKLMRLVVEYGTAKLAAAPGYVVGGKTGTAEKNRAGVIRKRSCCRISSARSRCTIRNTRC